MVQGTMPEFTEGEGLCTAKKGSGASDGGAAWGATSVLRVCVTQVCELCMGIMTLLYAHDQPSELQFLLTDFYSYPFRSRCV